MNTLPIAERANTTASGFYRRVMCPGSAFGELYAPESGGKDALHGTFLHAADAEGFELEDMSDAETVKRNQALRSEYISAELERRGIPQEARRKIIVEQRYVYRTEDGEPLLGIDGKPLSGQPDYVVLFPEHSLAFVFDSKFGRIAVPKSEVNFQVRVNCVLVHQEFDCDTVLGAITQPWASPNFHAVEYDRAAIAAATAEILRVWEIIKSPDAPRIPSLEACRYCKAKASCPEALKLVKGLVQVRLAEMPVPQLEALEPMFAQAQKIIDAYYERMEYIGQHQPDALSRFEMKPNSPTREITPENAAAVWSLLCSQGIVTDHERYDVTKFGIAALDKAIAKRFKIPLKDSKAKLAEVLGDLLTTHPKKSTLVERKLKLTELT